MSTRLVLGLGGTIDYEIDWDSSVLESLIDEYEITRGELDPETPIDTERDLVVSILGFLDSGQGGERFVGSVDVIERFSQRFGRRVALGGTCVRAAIAMATLGVESLVHLVCIDDSFRRLLPPEIRYICSAEQDSTHPHLIVQYGDDAIVAAGDIRVAAGRPNRLIYVNDLPNRELSISAELGPALEHARVFLLSGFNTIQDPQWLDERLATVAEYTARMPPGSTIVYEDAGFHLPSFSARVRDAMARVVEVFGMNEDEMQGHLGRSVSLLDPGDVVDALEVLHGLIPVPVLVIHTQHWALAHGEQAHRYAGALTGGVTMASTRYRLGDGFAATDYEATLDLAMDARGLAFRDELSALEPDQIVCRPAYRIDVAQPTTIGLGDSFVGGFLAALPGTQGGDR